MQPTNSDEENRLFRAIAEGDRELVKASIAADRELLYSYDYRNFGATPLTAACFGNQHELVDVLLDLGADPNRRSDWNMGPWSSLHCALYRHDRQLAEKLLARGAAMDAHTAAGLGLCSELKKLVDANPACVHERGGDGCFPLHFADTIAVADMLLEHGAEIDGRCIDHYSTPVQYLCTIRPEVAKHLMARGATPDIFSSVVSGDVDLIEKLLSENPKLVEARIDQAFFPPSSEHDVHNVLAFTVGQHATPLHAAASSNQAATVKVLVRFGAAINARGGYDSATPLHLAAWNDCLESAIELVNQGADLNAKSGKLHNNSPAGWAIVGGSLRVFEMLLDRGAEIFPWFIDDAKAGYNGQFDAVRRVGSEPRRRILELLEARSAG